MTGTQLAALIRKKTRTNSTTFTDADMLVDVNIFKDEISSLITLRNQMYFAVPATDNLVADQREYAFPSDMLNSLIKVEVKFTSSEARKRSIPLKEYHGSETESEIVAEFSNDKPYHVIRRKAVFLLSGTIIAVTSGIRIWYLQYPSDLSNLTGSTSLDVDPSTTTAGFPRQFHELLARRVSMEYKDRNGIKLSPLELNYERDLEKQLEAISAIDLALDIQGDDLSSEETGDNGFDY